jgi:hypothetical protein
MKPPFNAMLKRSFTGCACVLAAILGASACGSEAEAPLPPGTTGGTSAGTGNGMAGSAAPQGGTTSTTAGSPAIGGGGSGTSAGTSNGGSGGAGGAGGTVSGGSGGAGGTGGAGGSAGGGADLKETVGGPLNGAMLLGPCLSDNNLTVCSTNNSGACPAKKPDDPATGGKLTTDKMITLGGDPAKTYTITLHVQGEVEAKGYDNGMDQDGAKAHPNMDGFYVGGRPQTGDDYNVYLLRVSEPSKDYFLNSIKPPGITDHTTYLLEYTAKIQAKGGATIRLVAADTNCAMIKNCGPQPNGTAQCATPLVKQNVDPVAVAKNPTFNFTQAYNGQWIVLVVTDVTEG